MIFWKSQTPWPSLRGGFYDWYLDTTGGYWGVRRACAEPVHVQMNQSSRELAVVSRAFEAVKAKNVEAKFYLTRSSSAQVGKTIDCSVDTIRPNAVTDLGCSVGWPAAHEGILLLRLKLLNDRGILSTNEYWLAPPGESAEEKAWASWRAWKAAAPAVRVSALATRSDPTTVSINVSAADQGSAALMVRMQLVRKGVADSDNRVLPAFFSQNYVTLLPGEHAQLYVEHGAAEQGPLELKIDGYNVAPITVPVSKA